MMYREGCRHVLFIPERGVSVWEYGQKVEKESQAKEVEGKSIESLGRPVEGKNSTSLIYC